MLLWVLPTRAAASSNVRNSSTWAARCTPSAGFLTNESEHWPSFSIKLPPREGGLGLISALRLRLNDAHRAADMAPRGRHRHRRPVDACRAAGGAQPLLRVQHDRLAPHLLPALQYRKDVHDGGREAAPRVLQGPRGRRRRGLGRHPRLPRTLSRARTDNSRPRGRGDFGRARRDQSRTFPSQRTPEVAADVIPDCRSLLPTPCGG